jgi:hypothetical protein
MSGTVLPRTPLAHKIIARLKPLANMLSPRARLIFGRFEEYILNNREAIDNATEIAPTEAAFFVLLLTERERIDGIHNELYKRIEDLEDYLEAKREAGS